MKNKIYTPVIVYLAIGLSLLLVKTHANAQSSITIDASQQITNFVFIDANGLQDNTFHMFGEENIYKPAFSGAYSFGYSYLFDFGMFIRTNVGMRSAGASMVYDAINYEWKFQYIQGKLGLGYALNLGLINPYIAVSGYYGYMLKANQRLNNENFDILNSESIRKDDYGLNVPIGIRIDASDHISVYSEVSYLMGLQNIETTNSGQKAHNTAYQFRIGLSFTIN